MENFEIRQTELKGQGLYALVHFSANQVILPFKGEILDKKTVDELPLNKAAATLQIALLKYLDLSGLNSFFVNHSCNPNTSVKIISNKAFLIALRDIKPNEELCFDYALTSSDDPKEWEMNCYCGEWNCRKLISGFNIMNEKRKEQYLKMGIVPDYIIK